MAAITAAAFTNGSGTAATSFTTASKTWASGRQYQFIVSSRINSAVAAAPTISGATQVDTVAPAATGQARLTVLVWIGDGSTGTKTIDFGGVTQTACQWAVNEWQNTGIDGTATGGMGTPVHAAATSTGSPTVALAAFVDATNDATFFCAVNQLGLTTEATYTALAANGALDALASEYKVGQDLNPNFTVGGSSQSWAAIGIEIKTPGANVYNVSTTDAATAADAAKIVQVLGGASAENISATDAYANAWQAGPSWGGSGWREWHRGRPGGSKPGSPRRPF